MNQAYESVYLILIGLWTAYEFTTWTGNAPVRKMISFTFAVTAICIDILKLAMHFGYIVKA